MNIWGVNQEEKFWMTLFSTKKFNCETSAIHICWTRVHQLKNQDDKDHFKSLERKCILVKATVWYKGDKVSPNNFNLKKKLSYISSKTAV